METNVGRRIYGGKFRILHPFFRSSQISLTLLGIVQLNLHYSSTTYFLLPFATSLMNKHKIPVRSIKISFAKTITSTGEATLGKKLADRSNKPSKIRIYFSDNATFSCSFDNSSIIHPLDRTTLNPQGPVLLGLVASVVLDEVDEGRVPGLSSTFESKQVKKMVNLSSPSPPFYHVTVAD